ncbi:MAG: hypothetical protein NZX77_06040 [Polyangiaceae bacterium]|nr:hypothetical protein [Polyangiaceae bacterium]
MAQATTYAVHTEACTYLLDDNGLCCRILSPGGLVTSGMSAAIGAQFVACLDLTLPGGLVAELRVGSAALFATQDERGRYMLLRTSPIRHIEARQSSQPLLPPPVVSASLPQASSLPAPPRARPSRSSKPSSKSGRVVRTSGGGGVLPRPPSPVVLRGGEGTGFSLSEETLSLAKPLYRPPPPPLPDRPRAPPIPPPRTIARPPSPPPPPSTTPPSPGGRSPPPPPHPRTPAVSPPSSRQGPPEIPPVPPKARRTDPNRKGKR